MDTTLITSTAAVLALTAWAWAERRAWAWRRDAMRAHNWHRIADLRKAELHQYQRLNADIDAGIARQRELRLKRSQAALKGHQTRRQA